MSPQPRARLLQGTELWVVSGVTARLAAAREELRPRGALVQSVAEVRGELRPWGAPVQSVAEVRGCRTWAG